MRATTMRQRAWYLILGASLAACAAGEPGPNVRPEMLQASWASSDPVALGTEAVIDQVTLEGAAVGLAVQPDTGQRLALFGDGTLRDIDTGASLPTLTDPEGAFGFGDMVGLGDGLLAVTAMNDGYLVSTADGILRQHFCFLPGWQEFDPENVDPMQLSLALGFDAERERLYAQPRMWQNGGAGAVTDSFLSSYALGDGAELTWWNMPSVGVEAGGMVVLDAGPGDLGHDAPTLLLGMGERLVRFDGVTAALEPVATLGELGLWDVRGLAYDAANDTLLVAALVEGGTRVSTLSLGSLGL